VNFTIHELTRSAAAVSRGISNDPPPELLANGERLRLLLQEVRDLLGVPVDVSSGYRSPAVNKLVGGEPKSAHLQFLAADIRPRGMGLLEAFKRIVESKIQFDQVILEPNWIHIALPKPRLQALVAKRGERGFKYAPYLRD
jgi:hypothetical protein